MEPKSPKTILLVDDDPIFLKGMMYTIKQLGYECVMATGGREAAEKLKTISVDAIVSDINMPNGNGLQLLNHVKKVKPTPVILMTGLSDLKEAQTAIDMGARSFLSKPFKKVELSNALQSCFEKIEVSEEKQEEDMIKLHLEEFLQGQKMSFNIFMKRNDFMVKISNGGENLSPESINTYRESGIEVLYVAKKDFLDYLGLKDFPTTNVDQAKRAGIIEEAHKAIEKLSYLRPLNREAAQRAIWLVDLTLEILTVNNDMIEILERMRLNYPEIYFRSIHVATLSSLMGQYRGSTTTREHFILICSGLLHRIGLMDTHLAAYRDSIDELSLEDRSIFETHPERAIKDLSKVAHFPDEVLLLIEQQHENLIGTGFPNKLTSHFIHPLARVLTVSSSFMTELLSRPLTVEAAFELLDEFSVDTIGTFDMKSIESLFMVFNHSIPQEFVEYQLTQILEAVEA